MTIAIFGNSHHEKISLFVNQIIDFLQTKGDVDFVFEKKLFNLISAHALNYKIINDCGENFSADLAISIGGDGTFLKTTQYVAHRNIPIIGINMGRLGFLAETDETEIFNTLSNILAGNYTIEERSLLQITLSSGEVMERNFALNEIAITKKDESAMLNIATSINGEAVHTYLADGLLISTPTGSTAYSLSVGGPIAVPQAAVTLLSPIASHSLNVRPLIIPDSWTIDLKIISRNHSYMVAVDGRPNTLADDICLHICKADFTIKLIRCDEHTFFDTLRNKLMWGADKRQ
ncbi:MAG: NAD kinase [Paludibacter sp.]|jgi:NAD+ kinase|nr:NAD kinase [Paludibacter sp.]